MVTRGSFSLKLTWNRHLLWGLFVGVVIFRPLSKGYGSSVAMVDSSVGIVATTGFFIDGIFFIRYMIVSLS